MKLQKAAYTILAILLTLVITSCAPESVQPKLCRVSVRGEGTRALSAQIDPIGGYNIYYKSIYKGSGDSYGNMTGTVFKRLTSDGILVSQGRWEIQVAFSSISASAIDTSNPNSYEALATSGDIFINLNTTTITVTLQGDTGYAELSSYTLEEIPSSVSNPSVTATLYKYDGSAFTLHSSSFTTLTSNENTFSGNKAPLPTGIYCVILTTKGTVSGSEKDLFTDTLSFVVRSGLTTEITGTNRNYDAATSGGDYLVGPVIPDSGSTSGSTIVVDSGKVDGENITTVEDNAIYTFEGNVPHVSGGIEGQRLPTPQDDVKFAINLKGSDVTLSIANGNTTSESALFTTLNSGVFLTIYNDNESSSGTEATFAKIQTANSAAKNSRRLQTNIELNGPVISDGNPEGKSPTLNIVGRGAKEAISNSSIIFIGPDRDSCEAKKSLNAGETKQGSLNLSGSGGNITLDGEVELQGFAGISSWSTRLNGNNITPTLTSDIYSTIKILNGAAINVIGDVESSSIHTDDAQGIAIYGNNKGGVINIILDNNGAITTTHVGGNAVLSGSQTEAGILISNFTGDINITLTNNSRIASEFGYGVYLNNCTGTITISMDDSSSITGTSASSSVYARSSSPINYVTL